MSQQDDDLTIEVLKGMLQCLKVFATILSVCILIGWLVTGVAPWQIIFQ